MSELAMWLTVVKSVTMGRGNNIPCCRSKLNVVGIKGHRALQWDAVITSCVIRRVTQFIGLST